MHPAYQCFSDGNEEISTSASANKSKKKEIGINLSGYNRKSQRLRIYNFLLNALASDEQKIHITAKLCSDVLSYSVDNPLIFDCSDHVLFDNVICDVFEILKSPMLSVAPTATSAITNSQLGTEETEEGGDLEVDLDSARNMLMAKAKTKVWYCTLFFVFFHIYDRTVYLSLYYNYTV